MFEIVQKYGMRLFPLWGLPIFGLLLGSFVEQIGSWPVSLVFFPLAAIVFVRAMQPFLAGEMTQWQVFALVFAVPSLFGLWQCSFDFA